MKKCTSLVLAALFAANALTGYAESDARIVSRAAPVAAFERGASAAAPVAEVPSDYERLIAYRTEDYARKSVAEFNRLLMPEMSGIFEAHARVMETLKPEDANHDFIAITLNADVYKRQDLRQAVSEAHTYDFPEERTEVVRAQAQLRGHGGGGDGLGVVRSHVLELSLIHISPARTSTPARRRRSTACPSTR